MRGLNNDFLNAMREKLEHGRSKGLVGWDQKWDNITWPTHDPTQYLLDRLIVEVHELIDAVKQGDLSEIRSEAADVANFAMMIADIEGALSPARSGQIYRRIRR